MNQKECEDLSMLDRQTETEKRTSLLRVSLDGSTPCVSVTPSHIWSYRIRSTCVPSHRSSQTSGNAGCDVRLPYNIVPPAMAEVLHSCFHPFLGPYLPTMTTTVLAVRVCYTGRQRAAQILTLQGGSCCRHHHHHHHHLRPCSVRNTCRQSPVCALLCIDLPTR